MHIFLNHKVTLKSVQKVKESFYIWEFGSQGDNYRSVWHNQKETIVSNGSGLQGFLLT